MVKKNMPTDSKCYGLYLHTESNSVSIINKIITFAHDVWMINSQNLMVPLWNDVTHLSVNDYEW